MKKAALFVRLSLVVVGLACSPGTVSPQGRPAPHSATTKVRAVPVIRCTDADTKTACNSFKQLVDAKDEDMLASLEGRGGNGKHWAYACFRPQTDHFTLVEFDVPNTFPYSKAASDYIHAHSTQSPEILAVSDQADIEFFLVYQSSNPDFLKDNYPAKVELKKYWKELHSNSSEFNISDVFAKIYSDGIMSDYASDIGEWKRAVYGDGRLKTHGSPTFEGGRWVIMEHNKQSEVKLTVPDDPSKGHVSIDDANVYVNYSFQNKAGTSTDYLLTIHRSTGRFTEAFDADGSKSEDSGTCMIFN